MTVKPCNRPTVGAHRLRQIEFMDVFPFILTCHGYKLDSLNWCCLLLPCSDSEKFGLLMTNFWSFTVTSVNANTAQLYGRSASLLTYTAVNLPAV